MELRRARGVVKESETVMAIREEEIEEEDDNATLQDCLDRQKKVTKKVTARPKRAALTPLDDEDDIGRGRKKVKGMKELLATDSGRAGEMPCSLNDSPKRSASLVGGMLDGDNSLEGGKKRRVKKKRRRNVDVGRCNDENAHDSDIHNAPLTPESSRIRILIPKEELVEEVRFGVGSADQSSPETAGANQSGLRSPKSPVQPRRGSSEGVQSRPGILELPECNTHLREEIFLPVDGYHTCGDAESCHIACLKKVLDHLDKMSEEQLKLWYEAIIGEVFASRNGEKVRGRLRRMIRCKVKESIKSQGCSYVSTNSWSSSLEMQHIGAPSSLEPTVGSDPLMESPGSKLSTSNAGESCVEAEDAVCSGETFSKKPPVSHSSDLSRGLTFQLPSQSPSTNEASANSSVDDPEAAVPAVQFLVTARITRSKARVMEKSALDNGPGLQTTPEVCPSSLCQNSASVTKESEVPRPVPAVAPSGQSAERDVQCAPAEVGTERRTRSRKSFAAEKGPGEVSSSNVASKSRLSHVKTGRSVEEPKQPAVLSSQSGDSVEEGAPSLSDVVTKLLSDNRNKYGLIEITPLEGQVSPESVGRQSEGESLLTAAEVTTVEESLNSTVVSAASHSTAVAEIACETLIDGMEEVTFEGSHMNKPSESQGESVVNVCKHDDVAEESFVKEGRVSCSKIVFKEGHWEEVSFSEFEESSEFCSAKSSVGVTSCGVDNMNIHAHVNQDTEYFEEEVHFQKGFVTEAPQPRTISSNTAAVNPASSSTSVLETVSVCALNTECQGFPDEGNVEGSTEFFQKISFLAADCASSVQSLFCIPCDDPVQLAVELRSDEELHCPLDLDHCCAEAEEVALETGYEQLLEQVCAEKASSEEAAFGAGCYQFFQQLCADKVSCLWAPEGDTEASKRLDMEDYAQSNMVTEFEPANISGKWQLWKSESGRSDGAQAAEMVETAPLPNVWRDAGEFLEDLDNLYMMVGTDRRSSSSLGKRKYHDCDFADDCGKPSHGTHSDYATSRARQRVELISEQESFVATEKLSPEADDVQYFRGIEQAEQRNDPSMPLDCQTSVDAETSAISEEVQGPVSSQYHQQLWMDERRNEGSTVADNAPTEKEMASQDHSSEASFKAKFCMSPPPCLGDSFLVEPPLCDSPASTSEDEGSPESVSKSDACLDLLARERLVQEDDPKDYGKSSEFLAARKIESLREADSDESPPPIPPPIRLKLPSGRARLLACAVTESQIQSTRDWRYSVARDMDQKPRAATAKSLSPNSFDEETVDSIQEQESLFESAPAEERSSQEQSLVLSPPSSQPPSSGNSQEGNASPESHVPPPPTARCSKGILKRTSKCKDCVELRFLSRTALDFVASQMKTFGEVAGRLTKEIQELRSILETEVSDAEGSQKEGVMHDKFKAISRSREIERSAEKNLTLLLRDCKRFCKLTAKRPRKIVFADEAGKKLCHVKTFQAPPSLARPLWDIL